jgi:hypothetical protein
VSLFVRGQVRFDKDDAYDLIFRIREASPSVQLLAAADAVHEAVRNAQPVPLTDQVRLPREQVEELASGLRAAGAEGALWMSSTQ